MKPEITEKMVLKVLQRHLGKHKDIKISRLVYEITSYHSTTGEERQVRAHVKSLRNQGYHIASMPKYGYFIAQDQAELDESCKLLHDRAMSSLAQVAAMKRMAVPALLGQMKIDLQKPDTATHNT